MLGLTNILGNGSHGFLKPVEFEILQNEWVQNKNPMLGTNYSARITIACKEKDIFQVYFDEDSYLEAERCYIVPTITGENEATFYAKIKTGFDKLTGRYILGNVENDYSGTGPVIGVKGDAEEKYRVGKVNITKENLGIHEATETEAGLMSAEDKKKMNRLNSIRYDYKTRTLKIPATSEYIEDLKLIIIK